jgi:flagellar biosynthesis chaperone FliJ
MAPRSGLETLQKLRLSEERQQELLLQELNQRVSSLQQRISEIKLEVRERMDHEREKLAGILRASELHFDELCRSTLVAHGRALEAKLAAEVVQRDFRMRCLLQARQAREMVETLLRQRREADHREQLRREQQSVDEMFLLRAAYLSR